MMLFSLTFGKFKPKWPELVVLTIGFWLGACGVLTQRVPPEPIDSQVLENQKAAQNLLSRVERKNNSLENFKGIGKIKWLRHGKLLVARMAWLASESKRFRIEVLGLSGQPLASLASDGKWFYLISHSEHQFFKKRSLDSKLTRFIAGPIKFPDIVTLLAGRVPILKHTYVQLEKEEQSNNDILILLKKKQQIVQKIYLDETKTRVQKIEFYNTSGLLTYRAVFERIQTIKGYEVPLKLLISNDVDINFQLDVDRYWADISVSPTVFTLNPPEK